MIYRQICTFAILLSTFTVLKKKEILLTTMNRDMWKD